MPQAIDDPTVLRDRHVEAGPTESVGPDRS
jgi:hypothetical protein